MIRFMSMVAVCTSLTFVGVAQAQEADEDGWSLSGEVGLVSDYQYRGYSLSGGDPVVQGGLTLDAPGGFYVGVWGSEIEEYGVGADGDGAKIEVDISVGRAFSAGGWDWDVALLHYGYPDGSAVDYFEIPVSAARTTGDFTTTLGVEYAPRQDNLGDEDNLYLYIGGDYAPESWPVSLSARLGHEEGAFADGKLDWQLGVAKELGPVSLTLQYTDSDGPGAESAAVAGISVGF
ncbi:MAG TPA: TorF family putative porin [Caulobacter sp.]|nr:TorF family putative porin [Caulobacter sp.]